MTQQESTEYDSPTEEQLHNINLNIKDKLILSPMHQTSSRITPLRNSPREAKEAEARELRLPKVSNLIF